MRLGTAEDPMAQAGRSNRRENLLTRLGNPTADLRPPRWFPRLGTHAELTLAAAATHGWGGLLWCPWDRVADMFSTVYVLNSQPGNTRSILRTEYTSIHYATNLASPFPSQLRSFCSASKRWGGQNALAHWICW